MLSITNLIRNHASHIITINVADSIHDSSSSSDSQALGPLS